MPTKLGSPSVGPRDPSASWLMPELVLALAPVSTKDWIIPAGVSTQVLTPNPRRIGLVIVTSIADAGGTFVSPYGDANVFGVPVPTTTRLVSFAVDDLYSLVGGGWYVYNAAGTTVRVSQFERPA